MRSPLPRSVVDNPASKLLPAFQPVLTAKAELCGRIHHTLHNAKLAPLVILEKATDACRKPSKNSIATDAAIFMPCLPMTLCTFTM